ncbi:MAG: hypothetical protein FJ049_10440 [Cyanobacteria bacterium M_surface_7_m2_037]|nr:hypothetical protein [Cyanobacteria bacterium M_surface_7_m2_037]
MNDPLVFVIAPAASLPEGDVSWNDLLTAQRQGPGGAFALRLFTAAGTAADQLTQLPWEGALEPLGGGQQRRLICDAVVPQFDPRSNAIGVYGRNDEADRYRCLDRFPLLDANNETCWFYPTHDGSFLSWERALAITLEPGMVAAEAQPQAPTHYERSELKLLWSLLADDVSLTCVGLTYGGQRIEWPQTHSRPEPMATWSLFTVDTQADVALTVQASQTVFLETGNDPILEP